MTNKIALLCCIGTAVMIQFLLKDCNDSYAEEKQSANSPHKKNYIFWAEREGEALPPLQK